MEDSKELFLMIPPQQKDAIRQKLLECLQRETLPPVRHKIGDAVAEIARQYSDNDEPWPELLQVLFVASQSPDPVQREGAFRIFTTTPGIIQSQHEDTVVGAFTRGFKDEDFTVRLSVSLC